MRECLIKLKRDDMLEILAPSPRAVKTPKPKAVPTTNSGMPGIPLSLDGLQLASMPSTPLTSIPLEIDNEIYQSGDIINSPRSPHSI